VRINECAINKETERDGVSGVALHMFGGQRLHP